MRRVQQLAAHIAANGDGDSAARGVSASATDAKVTVDMEETDILKSMGGIDALFTVLEKQLPKAGDYDIAQHVASPLTDAAKYPNGWVDAFKEFRAASEAGEPHVQHQRWQEAYGDDGLSSNLVVPYLIFKRSDGDVGKRLPPVITHEVIISNPSDAMRIARMHVKVGVGCFVWDEGRSGMQILLGDKRTNSFILNLRRNNPTSTSSFTTR